MTRVSAWLFATAALSVALLAAPASAQFETRGTTPLQSASEPFGVAVGDFNHDGNLDAALADFFADQVAVLLGKGDGTFQTPAYYSVGIEPRSVTLADLNHDGNVDLVVSGESSPGNGTITVLFGNGDGTFQQPATDLSLSAYSSFVAVADFNDDGIPDLLAADPPYVSVLLGNGDGTFQPPNNNDSFSPIPPSVVGVGDFNGDGKLDLVVAGQYGADSDLVVLLGNGDGTFQLGASYDIGADPQSVAVADFRRIGMLDVAIADGSGVQILLGNGDGTFKSPATNTVAGLASGLAVGDFNRDGKPDLATTVLGSFSSEVGALLGNGDGTFQPVQTYPAGRSGFYLAVGDFNGDRQPDLVVADAFISSSSAIVLLNTGVVSFSPTTPLNFKKQAVGTTSPPQTVTLTNTGSKALRIASMKASTEFGVTSACGSSVAAGAKCTISVTFSPTQKGAKQGTITIIDSASTKPQVIELLGRGT